MHGKKTYIAKPEVRATCPPMAYSLSYDADKKIILVVQSGTANHYKEMLDWMMLARTDRRFSREYGILCDLREGMVRLSPTDAYTCGSILKYFFPGQRIAFVIPGGLKAILEQLALAVQTTAKVRDFAELRDAESWLGAAA